MLVYLHYWLVAVGGLGSLLAWKIFGWRKKKSDVDIVAILQRERDEDLKGYVLAKKDYVHRQPYDLIAEIEGRALRNLGVFGQGGAGKSKLLSWFCWTYSTLNVKVFAFNYHKFQKGEGDFEGLGFKYVNIAKNLPYVFKPEYKEFLIRAFAVVFVSQINRTGLMASMLEEVFRKILNVAPCRDWNEFERNARRVTKESSGLEQDVASIVALKVSSLNVGEIKEIEFDFSKSYLLDFAYLLNDLAKNLYSEFYANLIYKKAEEESVAGRPHSIMLAIDECHRLLKYGDISITAEILRNARKHMRVAIATQSMTDVLEGLRHFQHFQFKTHNSKDVDEISKISPLHAEAVRQLKEREFVWVNEGSVEQISIFELDIINLETARLETKVNEAYREPDENFVEEETKSVEIEKKEEEKLDEKIIVALQQSNVPLYGYEIGKSIGLPPKEAGLKVKQPLRILEKGGKVNGWKCQIRKEEKPFYYLANDSREVCHNLMMIEVEKRIDSSWKIVFKATHGTQGADFTIEKNGRKLSIECETWLKNDISDLQGRVAKEEETIIVVPTTLTKGFYQRLFECKVVLIPELEEALN